MPWLRAQLGRLLLFGKDYLRSNALSRVLKSDPNKGECVALQSR